MCDLLHLGGRRGHKREEKTREHERQDETAPTAYAASLIWVQLPDEHPNAASLIWLQLPDEHPHNRRFAHMAMSLSGPAVFLLFGDSHGRMRLRMDCCACDNWHCGEWSGRCFCWPWRGCLPRCRPAPLFCLSSVSLFRIGRRRVGVDAAL